jgi:hypothetical protein
MEGVGDKGRESFTGLENRPETEAESRRCGPALIVGSPLMVAEDWSEHVISGRSACSTSQTRTRVSSRS